MHRILYHNGDLDGWTSAAIYASERKKFTFHPMEYGETEALEHFLLNVLEEIDVVVMLDFCPNDPTVTQQIIEKSAVFYWIDHHKSTRKMYEEYNFEAIHTPPGRLITDSDEFPMAACELTYMFVHNVEYHKVPYHVRLLGRYDIWDHKDPNVIPFQYAMQAWLGEPSTNYQQWNKLLYPTRADNDLFQKLIESGKYIRLYTERHNKKVAEDICFELEFEGYKAIAANTSHGSSHFFSAVYDPRVYDLAIAFCYTNSFWKVSLRSETIDCSVLAAKYSGGGHKGASGFVCETLPSEISSVILRETAKR